jgi:hypothetical protein
MKQIQVLGEDPIYSGGKYIGYEGKSNGPALRDGGTIIPYLFRIP